MYSCQQYQNKQVKMTTTSLYQVHIDQNMNIFRFDQNKETNEKESEKKTDKNRHQKQKLAAFNQIILND